MERSVWTSSARLAVDVAGVSGMTGDPVKRAVAKAGPLAYGISKQGQQGK